MFRLVMLAVAVVVGLPAVSQAAATQLPVDALPRQRGPSARLPADPERGRSSPYRPYDLSLSLVADGFDQPIFVTHAGDGSGRLFVVERAGLIRIISNGRVLPEPFLDIRRKVTWDNTERGMLGLAFHPRFAENGLFYVTYTSPIDQWVLERYRVSSDPDRTDPSSATTLIELPEPGYFMGYHYGGMLAFGPDGYLYGSVGDGASNLENAQDRTSLLGSMFRIDVDAGEPYGIPADNPFVGLPDVRPEIWAYGLRNPWRFSFDRDAGDLYIGDVGDYAPGEINLQPAGSPGGENFGWAYAEGYECTDYRPDCVLPDFTPPIWFHEPESRLGCAIIGGYVYRGAAASPLYGSYVFGDYCAGTVWAIRRDRHGEWTLRARLETSMQISSFGEDEAGELYVADLLSGAIFRVSSQPRARTVEQP